MVQFNANPTGAKDKPEEADFCDSESALVAFGVEAEFLYPFEHFSHRMFVLPLVGRVYQYVGEVPHSNVVKERP